MSSIAILNVIWIASIKRLVIIHIKCLNMYLLPLAVVLMATMAHILIQTVSKLGHRSLEKETENNLNNNLNNPKIFNKEDKLYHEANNTCHI